jgi:hypothetical protein
VFVVVIVRILSGRAGGHPVVIVRYIAARSEGVIYRDRGQG